MRAAYPRYVARKVGRAAQLVASVSLLTIWATTLVQAPPRPAQADVNCSAQYNVEASKDSNLHRSVRVWQPGMWVEDTAVNCGRVSSINLIYDSANFVELGWLDINQTNDPQGANCPVFSGTVPRRFWLTRYKGQYTCVFGSTISALDYHWFRIANSDFDNQYDFFVDGVFWQSSPTLSFTAGTPVTNGERDGGYDSAFAHFDGLQYENASGWHDWTSTDPYVVVDPDYWNYIASCTEVLVLTTSPFDGC